MGPMRTLPIGPNAMPARRPVPQHAWKAWMLVPCLAGLLMLLAACATGGPDRRLLEDTLYDYSSAIRWGEIDAALGHVDPEWLAEHPLDGVARRRFEQSQVTGYYVRKRSEDAEGQLQLLVELRLVNRHTQTERVVMDRQRWRWDAEDKRWWLVSGLPDLSPG